MEETGELWNQRYKTEQLLEVRCPKCGAGPQKWCDRTADELSKHGRALLKAGTPPSHQERLWTRQGHAEHELPGLLARQRPGWDETAPGKGKPRPVARGGCGPCSRERAIRAGPADPNFPVDFPCLHPAAGPVPGFPVRYDGERACPECRFVAVVAVVIQSPGTIGFRCGQGHMWLAGHRWAAPHQVLLTGLEPALAPF